MVNLLLCTHQFSSFSMQRNVHNTVNVYQVHSKIYSLYLYQYEISRQSSCLFAFYIAKCVKGSRRLLVPVNPSGIAFNKTPLLARSQ